MKAILTVHAKYESLASAGIALLLLLVCFNVLSDSIERFLHPVQPEIATTSFLVMAITLLINIVVMLYERNKGRLLQSQILISDAVHTSADIFTTSSVILGLLVIRESNRGRSFRAFLTGWLIYDRGCGMLGLARLDAPGVLHNMIGRGIERRKIFLNDKDRVDLIDRLD